MTRTQIYLSERLNQALARLSQETGRSRSQLIREALERSYLQEADHDARLAALEASHGAWRRRANGKAFVEASRKGRLARLYADDAAS